MSFMVKNSKEALNLQLKAAAVFIIPIILISPRRFSYEVSFLLWVVLADFSLLLQYSLLFHFSFLFLY